MHSGISHIICTLYLNAVVLDTYSREQILPTVSCTFAGAILGLLWWGVSASICFNLSRPVCDISFPLFLFKNHLNSTSSNNYRLPHSSFSSCDTTRCLKSIKTCCLYPYFCWVTYSHQPCLSGYQGLHAQKVKRRFAVTARLLVVIPGLGLAKNSRLHSVVEEATYVSLF